MIPSVFEIQAEFCKAMGNATRLQILHVLRGGPMIVVEIVKETGFSQSVVSRQLNILRHVGVLKCHRQKNEMIYQFANESIAEVCDLVRKVLLTQIRNDAHILDGTL